MTEQLFMPPGPREGEYDWTPEGVGEFVEKYSSIGSPESLRTENRRKRKEELRLYDDDGSLRPGMVAPPPEAEPSPCNPDEISAVIQGLGRPDEPWRTTLPGVQQWSIEVQRFPLSRVLERKASVESSDSDFPDSLMNAEMVAAILVGQRSADLASRRKIGFALYVYPAQRQGEGGGERFVLQRNNAFSPPKLVSDEQEIADLTGLIEQAKQAVQGQATEGDELSY